MRPQIPLLVVIAWGMGKDLSLNFQPFETAVIFLTVVIVSAMIQKGKSTWLSGLMLVIGYTFVAAAFFVHVSDS